jgi:hypothetical protein
MRIFRVNEALRCFLKFNDQETVHLFK